MNHIGFQMLSVIKLGRTSFRDSVVQKEDNLFIAVLQKQAWKLLPVNDLAGRTAVSLLWFSKHGHSIWVVMFYVCDRTVVNHLIRAEGKSWAAGHVSVWQPLQTHLASSHTQTLMDFFWRLLCVHTNIECITCGGRLFYFQLPHPSLDLPQKHK